MTWYSIELKNDNIVHQLNKWTRIVHACFNHMQRFLVVLFVDPVVAVLGAPLGHLAEDGALFVGFLLSDGSFRIGGSLTISLGSSRPGCLVCPSSGGNICNSCNSCQLLGGLLCCSSSSCSSFSCGCCSRIGVVGSNCSSTISSGSLTIARSVQRRLSKHILTWIEKSRALDCDEI